MEYLEELGVPCALNPYLVRGLDYYTRTVFEFLDPELGALAAGGRYDYLLKTLGAKDEPAVGGACGIDRIVLALQREGKLKEPNEEKRVFVAHAGSAAKKRALAMSDLLVASGLSVRDALSKPSLSAQLKVANKEGIALAVIVGQKEMLERTAIIRDFKTGLQETFPEGKIASEVRDRLRHA